MVPAFSARLTALAMFRFFVTTPAARPYFVLFARSITYRQALLVRDMPARHAYKTSSSVIWIGNFSALPVCPGACRMLSCRH